MGSGRTAVDPVVDPVVGELAVSLQVVIGRLVRQLRRCTDSAGDDLSAPESSALAWLDRGGPTTASALAKLERISAQSMGATLSALEDRKMIERHPDPGDGRRQVVSISARGVEALRSRRSARAERLAAALSSGAFTPAELQQLSASAPLLERLAQQL